MLTIYLACLLFGGALLVFTIAFGSEADAETHFDMDVETGADIHGEGLAAAVQFLSFRNFVFFTAFFGLTGATLTWTGAGLVVALGFAVLMGFGAAVVCHKLMQYLKESESGVVTNLSECVGITARVTLPVAEGKRGKVSIASRDRSLQILARLAEESGRREFAAGDAATIVRVVDGVAEIAGEDFIG